MWDNSVWEQENQESLKQWYEEQIEGGFLYEPPVRRIYCQGCDKTFYTRVRSKKYCSSACWAIGTAKQKRHERYLNRADTICAACGKTFTPKRSDARYCSNACKQQAYRNRVTDNEKCQNGTFH